MPPTLIRSRPSSTIASPGRTAASWAAAGIVALLGAVGAGEVLDPPRTVDLVVTNESERAVTVVVASPGGGSLPIATLGPGEERAVAGVLDQGADWVVSHRVAGQPAGSEVPLPRSSLEAAGHRITIPADAAPAAITDGAEETTEG